MGKKNWQSKNKVKKANDRRGKDSSKIAQDALVELKNPLYAYKILNNSKRPLVADNGKAIVILYDVKVFDNVIFDIEEVKTKVEDADDGVKTKGRKITKYKVVSVSNFEGNTGDFDIFSRTPIRETTYDKTDLNVFTFEDNNGTFERDEVTGKNTVKNGEALSLISINSLPILKNQEIHFETYNTISDIPQLKPNYKVKSIGFRMPIKTGVGRVTARAIENSVEINLDLKLDELKTTTNLFISKFIVKDEERYDQEESYISPFVQLNWKDAIKYFDLTEVKTVLDVKDDDDKWILNLIYGLCALYYIQDSNYGAVTRDANGNINDSVRGYSLSKADEISDNDINSGYIEYCINKIGDSKKILLGYSYAAMFSKYVVSKYTFAEPIYEYAQLWNFDLNYTYDEKLKTIDDYSIDIKLKLFSNVYNIENTAAAGAAASIEITGIKEQFKSISAVRNVGQVITADIEFIDDQLVEHDISIFNGENENKDINKYFAFHAIKDYKKLTNYYSQEESEIHNTGETVTKNIVKTYSLIEFYKYLLDNKEDTYRKFTELKIPLAPYTGQTLFLNSIEAILGGRLPFFNVATASDWTIVSQLPENLYDRMMADLGSPRGLPNGYNAFISAMNNIYNMKDIITGTSNVFGAKLNKQLLFDYELISNKNGRVFKINSADERKYFVDYITNKLPDQDALKNENLSLKQTLVDFSIQLTIQNEYIYTQDVTVTALSKNNRIVDEQKILDRQVILNDSSLFEFWTKFEPQHEDQITSILELKLWTRYGGQFIYIKEYEYEDSNGDIISERKEYTFDLSATHAVENALTTIYDQ